MRQVYMGEKESRRIGVYTLGSGLPLQQFSDFFGVDFGICNMSACQARDVEAFEVTADLAISTATDTGLEKHGMLAHGAPRCNYLSHFDTYSLVRVFNHFTVYIKLSDFVLTKC